MTTKENPGSARQRTGAKTPIKALDQSTAKLASNSGARTPYLITAEGRQPFVIAVSGRIKWALDRLRAARSDGCTPITQPAPRWSAYVFSLRQLGVKIETIHEPHGGDYAGTHARYVLRCEVAAMAQGGSR